MPAAAFPIRPAGRSPCPAGRAVAVQWDGRQVRLLDPATGELLREHRPQRAGVSEPRPADERCRTPPTVRRYLERYPAAPLTLRQIDPLIRELTQYGAVIAGKTRELPT